MNIVGKFFRDKNVAFYFALSFAAASVIVAIVYVAALSGLEGYVSYIPLLLLLAGAAAFVGLSLLGSCRLGSAVMSVADFAAFIAYVATIYKYPVEQAMSVGDASQIKYLPMIIACAVLMFICAVGSNVMAWIRQRKKSRAPKKDNAVGVVGTQGRNV